MRLTLPTNGTVLLTGNFNILMSPYVAQGVSMQFRKMRVEDIKPDPDQPRKTFDEESIQSLAETYKTQGVIEPLQVSSDGMLILGERRWRAAKVAGVEEVPVLVYDPKDPEDRLVRQLVEEFHREGIKPLERARAIQRLVNFGLSIREVSGSVGVPPSTADGLLAMLTEPEVEKAIEEEKVEPTKAVELQKALGVERAKEFIQSSTEDELRELPIHTAIRPLKKAPEKVKNAVAKGEVDAQDVREVLDVMPPEEEEQEDVLDDLASMKKAREAERRHLKKVVKERKIRSETVVDKSQKAMDERKVNYVRRRVEALSYIIPASISGIKDEDLKEEAIQWLVRGYQHLKGVLENLGRFDETLPGVITIEGEEVED